MANQVSWTSPLGISVALFLVPAVLMVVVGVLTPFFVFDNAAARPITALFTTARADRDLFGADPASIAAADPALVRLRYVLVITIAGLLVLVGVSEIGIAWFGLRAGEGWALAILATANVAVLPFWYLALRPYLSAGVALGLGDVPPFIWLPALLLLPAALLGWIGTR